MVIKKIRIEYKSHSGGKFYREPKTLAKPWSEKVRNLQAFSYLAGRFIDEGVKLIGDDRKLVSLLGREEQGAPGDGSGDAS